MSAKIREGATDQSDLTTDLRSLTTTDQTDLRWDQQTFSTISVLIYIFYDEPKIAEHSSPATHAAAMTSRDDPAKQKAPPGEYARALANGNILRCLPLELRQ